MNGPGRGRGRGRGGFKGNRFDRERERGPQIDTWTNETAENAEKENSSKYSRRLRIVTCAKGFYPKFILLVLYITVCVLSA